MKKPGIFSKDWFIALLVGLLVYFAVYQQFPLLERLESIAYDAGVNMTYRAARATDKVAIIAIDDPSIKAIGRWPWPRSVLADLLTQIGKAQPKVVGLQIFLSEPQTDAGLTHIRELREYVDSIKLPRNPPAYMREIRTRLENASAELDADSKLSQALPRVRSLYLPMFFEFGKPLGKPDSEPADFIRRSRLTKIVTPPAGEGKVRPTKQIFPPLAQFGERATGVGHSHLIFDAAGGVRTETLLVEHYGEYYPSLSLLVAARSMNLSPRDIEVELGEGVRVGNLYIKTDTQMRMYSGFYPYANEVSPFSIYSFHDVRAGNVPASVFRDKIVLIGAAKATGVGNKLLTPVRASMDEPEFTANVITSILNQDFYTRPPWAMWVELGLFVAILFYLMFALPNMGARVAALVSFILLTALLVAGQYMMLGEKIWLRSVSPALFLLIGHVVLTSKRFFMTERLKLAAESDSVETNRMLGLAFQGQGQLDMALDKFRKLPVDESVLELIYNLALDFERKRQFNKASAAYDYILSHESPFRDVAERKKRARQAEQTVILGGARGSSATGTLVLDGVDQKPTLGRYQVERELGRGAMGTVYLGRDPKINRVVAIKTLPLSEFEPSELAKVKDRFFREAETAGRLNHPNIVTIYDAGEEHDLAFIAMEFLQGKDLTHYLNGKKPLPFDWVMEVIGQVADALDYAHRQEVVHRDIKPANIMYNEADRSVKVTDFGIARVTDSTKTKTGVILGTPSYMSPEQVAGKRVDGRSDLFSLGVTMFELMVGQQPFTGDSLAALMYQITNSKHPDVTRLRSDLPSCMRTILDRLLQKKADKRYQSGAELKQAMLKCMNSYASSEASG